MRKSLTALFLLILPLVVTVGAFIIIFALEETYSQAGGGELGDYGTRYGEAT